MCTHLLLCTYVHVCEHILFLDLQKRSTELEMLLENCVCIHVCVCVCMCVCACVHVCVHAQVQLVGKEGAWGQEGTGILHHPCRHMHFCFSLWSINHAALEI